MSNELYDGIFLPVRAALKAKGVPFEFTYGPPQVPTTTGATRLYMSADYDSGDRMKPARTQEFNPQQVSICSAAMLVRIYASSVREGQQRHDHEGLARQLAAMTRVALHHVTKAAKTNYEITRSGLLPDLTTDGWKGVVYDVRFEVDTGDEDISFQGDAAAEFTPESGSISTTLAVDGPDADTTLPTATTRVN